MGPQPENEPRPWPLRVPRQLIASGVIKLFMGSDAIVYLVLLFFENSRTHKCWPSIQTICSLSGLSRPTVIKSLKRLESIRVIEIVRRKGRASAYMICQSFSGTSTRPLYHHPQVREKAEPVQDLYTTTSKAAALLPPVQKPLPELSLIEPSIVNSPPTPSPAPTSPQGSNGAEGEEDKAKAYFGHYLERSEAAKDKIHREAEKIRSREEARKS